MARVAFFCIPAHGHTNPTLGVVRELTDRGHQVVYYSYVPFRAKIEAAGAQFIPCDSFDAELHLTKEEASRLGSDLALSTRVLVDTTLSLDDVVCADMQLQKPDCIVADSMAVWGKAAARKLGIPFVSSTTTFAFNQHSAKVMKQSPRELVSLLLSLPKIQKHIKRLQKKGYPVKSVLDLIQNDDDTHTIVYTSRSFQPCSDTFSHKYAFVGPILRPIQQPFEKKREKLVYLSMGTVNNDLLPLYRGFLQQLSDSPWQVVLSVGEQVPLSAFGTIPEQVEIYPSVDQMALLQQADAFVTHCGMNSVSEALSFGVPLVLLPKTKEQEGVAARVLELGAGIRADEAQLRSALETVLSDPSYRQQAQTIAADFHACPGAKGAADKIEAVLER